jgi:hypothetical protein
MPVSMLCETPVRSQPSSDHVGLVAGAAGAPSANADETRLFSQSSSGAAVAAGIETPMFFTPLGWPRWQ